MSRMLARAAWWLSTGVIGFLAVACGASGDGDGLSHNPSNAAGDEGTFGGAGTFSGDGSVVDPDAFTACASDTQQASQLPLDLYLMIDTSNSMAALVTASMTKWTAVKAALTSFVQDPASAGIGV